MQNKLNSSKIEGKEGNTITLLVKLANRAIRKEMKLQLHSYGITPTQWSALGYIYKHPGLLPSQLQTILFIERSSVTSLINGLEKRELVHREDHPEDGRYKRLYLTDKGREIAIQTRHLADDIDEKVGSAYTVEEFKLLKTMILKIMSELGEE